MNCVSLHYTESQTAYDDLLMSQDGDHLLSTLAKAKRYRELVAEGTISKDDFRRNSSLN